MKILWVKHGKLLPVNTGGKIRTYNILRHLASRHDVTLISSYSGKQAPEYESELRQHFPKSIVICTGAPEDSDGIVKQGVHYIARAGSSVPYAVSKFTTREVRRIVKKKLDSREFDVAVCDFLAASLNFPKQLNTPTVLFQHNVEASIWQRQAGVRETLAQETSVHHGSGKDAAIRSGGNKAVSSCSRRIGNRSES